MYSELINHIRQYISLSDEDILQIEEHTRCIDLKNKEYLVEAGQICKYYFFVKKGCLRMFFYTDKGSEQITHFALENWWISDFFSILDQKISDYTIQAIEKSEVLAIHYKDFNELVYKIPSLEHYFRIMMQRALAASQYRIKLLYSLSKEELYLHFSSYFPEFSKRVPQYMLASFLGLTPEYVSEVRKKKL